MLTVDMWYGFILGLIGAGVGALITHFLSKSRRNEERLNKAASEFEVAFLPKIIYLRHNANIGQGAFTDDLSRDLYGAYLRHLKALTIYKSSVPRNKRKKIDVVWKEYCHDPQNNEKLFFEQYSTKTMKGQDKIHVRNLALNRLEKLIETTK